MGTSLGDIPDGNAGDGGSVAWNKTNAENWKLLVRGTEDASYAYRLERTSGNWKGKAMLYFGRWDSPSASVTCATSSPPAIAMYTDFVGDDASTKAALYMIPHNNADLSSISNFDLQALAR